MTAYNPTGENPTDLSKRAVRALTEKMSVLPDAPSVSGAAEMFVVVSESGSQYTVDLREGRCTCPDAQYNLCGDDRVCKHVQRSLYATGEKSLPTWVDTDAVDTRLGTHTTSPRGNSESATDRLTPDGGTLAEGSEQPEDSCPNGDPRCDGPSGDAFPCFPCYDGGAAPTEGDR